MDANKEWLNSIGGPIQSDEEPRCQENLLYNALQSYLEANPGRKDEMREMDERSPA